MRLSALATTRKSQSEAIANLVAPSSPPHSKDDLTALFRRSF
jgi:hypothetical protein